MTVLESIGLNQSRVVAYFAARGAYPPPTPPQSTANPSRPTGRSMYAPATRALQPNSTAGRIRALLADRELDTEQVGNAIGIDKSQARRHLQQLLKFKHVRLVRPAKLGGQGYPAMWGRGEATR